MSSYNLVVLVGNFTRDPELRVIPTGASICTFGLAVNNKFTKGDGTQGEEVLFIDVEAWGKQGELVSKYCTKGSQALIQGRLKLDSWDDKTSGQKRTKIKVVMQSIQFLGAPRSAAPGGQAAAPPPAARRQYQDNLDEDVPF